MRKLIALLLLLACPVAQAEDLWVPATGQFAPTNTQVYVPAEGAFFFWEVTNLYNGVRCESAYNQPLKRSYATGYPAFNSDYLVCNMWTSIQLHNQFDGITALRVFGKHPRWTFTAAKPSALDSCSIFAQNKWGQNFWSSTLTSQNNSSQNNKNFELTFSVPKSVTDNAPYLTLFCPLVGDQQIYGYRVTFDWAF